MLLLLSFSLPAVVALRSLSGVAAVRDFAARTEALASIQGRLQSRLVDEASTSLLANALIVDAMRAALAEVAASGLADGGEGERLAELRSVVARRNVLPPEVILEGVVLMQRLQERETARQAALLQDLRADAAREVGYAAWGFLTVSVLAAWFLWMRVVRPLRGLQSLLGMVGEGRFERAPTRRLHPVMVPVFEHYNQLVERLEHLEAAHVERAETLEESVRSATSALIEQQQALARSEKLAAVGETAAGVAHELRNPLAGAAIALQNLRRDVDEPDLAQRLDDVSSEVSRAVRTLNEYLRSARHAPEEPEDVDVGRMIAELVGLLRYQAPPGVTVETEAEPGLRAVLPRERLRQALTNLILNSMQALSAGPGRVRVVAQRRSGELEIRVEDDGPGFTADLLRVGPQPFATGRDGGTGLGLAIARRTAQDLGGRLMIFNLPSGGAGASLTVPIQDA